MNSQTLPKTAENIQSSELAEKYFNSSKSLVCLPKPLLLNLYCLKINAIQLAHFLLEEPSELLSNADSMNDLSHEASTQPDMAGFWQFNTIRLTGKITRAPDYKSKHFSHHHFRFRFHHMACSKMTLETISTLVTVKHNGSESGQSVNVKILIVSIVEPQKVNMKKFT